MWLLDASAFGQDLGLENNRFYSARPTQSTMLTSKTQSSFLEDGAARHGV
jgi:hypothetical protein